MPQNNSLNRNMIKNSIVAVLMIGTMIIINFYDTSSNVIVSKKNLDRLPQIIGEFKSTNIPISKSIDKELNTDIYLFRHYKNSDGKFVTLYIGYYGTRKGGRTGHNPLACYPSAGWAILKESKAEISIQLNDQFKHYLFNKLIIKKGNQHQLVYHWYQYKGGKVISSGIDQNIYRFKNKIFNNRNEGAFIRLSVNFENEMEMNEDLLTKFLKDLFPLIVEYWPEEKQI